MIFTICIFKGGSSYGQEGLTIAPEISLGTEAQSSGFLKSSIFQRQVMVSFSKKPIPNSSAWEYWSPVSHTGINVGVTDFNSSSRGYAFSAMGFMVLKSKRLRRWSLQLGYGASYFTNKFDIEDNIENRSISTDITWSNRAVLQYTFLEKNRVDYSIGLGAMHHSNGHTRLPNDGINTFHLSLAAAIKSKEKNTVATIPIMRERSIYHYLSARLGLGLNALGDSFPLDDKKGVYSLSGEYGLVFNKVMSIGIGGFYRYYEHYYDYIKNGEFLVRENEEFNSYTKQPWHNATNYGAFVKFELLLNHIGIEILTGFNFHKPGYDIDWRINGGWEFIPRDPPDYWIFGEFDSEYKLKKLLTTRLGIKYYLKATENVPKHNMYIGAFINGNGGQADFSEIGLGYVYNWNFRKRN
ncbi:acyloxyacyl hydrolase [Dokdonia sinensis]|uniref:acyloxyacyl hydrolase n=1 Tax=Dokdonia sinensis TaxID=2479847 RepID=UPI001374E4FF|nr:acyloxyacyl hydrolase [Dokdonia sinensis]